VAIKKDWLLAAVLFLGTVVFFFLVTPRSWWLIVSGVFLIALNLLAITGVISHNWRWSLWVAGIAALILILKVTAYLTWSILLAAGLLLLFLGLYFFL